MTSGISIYMENGNTVFDGSNIIIFLNNKEDNALEINANVEHVTLKGFTILGNYHLGLKARLAMWLVKKLLNLRTNNFGWLKQ